MIQGIDCTKDTMMTIQSGWTQNYNHSVDFDCTDSDNTVYCYLNCKHVVELLWLSFVVADSNRLNVLYRL